VLLTGQDRKWSYIISRYYPFPGRTEKNKKNSSEDNHVSAETRTRYLVESK
jgi:hypothetical protein